MTALAEFERYGDAVLVDIHFTLLVTQAEKRGVKQSTVDVEEYEYTNVRQVVTACDLCKKSRVL